MALHVERIEARADSLEILASGDRVETAGDLLFDLRNANGTLRDIVRERDSQIANEAQDGAGIQAEWRNKLGVSDCFAVA